MKPKICIIGEESNLSKLIIEYALKNHKPIIAVDDNSQQPKVFKVEDFILSNEGEKDESVE